MNEKNNYWYQLKDDFTDFLREIGYSQSSLTHYRGQIDWLIRYANYPVWKGLLKNIWVSVERNIQINFRKKAIRPIHSDILSRFICLKPEIPSLR